MGGHDLKAITAWHGSVPGLSFVTFFRPIHVHNFTPIKLPSVPIRAVTCNHLEISQSACLGRICSHGSIVGQKIILMLSCQAWTLSHPVETCEYYRLGGSLNVNFPETKAQHHFASSTPKFECPSGYLAFFSAMHRLPFIIAYMYNIHEHVWVEVSWVVLLPTLSTLMRGLRMSHLHSAIPNIPFLVSAGPATPAT